MTYTYSDVSLTPSNMHISDFSWKFATITFISWYSCFFHFYVFNRRLGVHAGDIICYYFKHPKSICLNWNVLILFFVLAWRCSWCCITWILYRCRPGVVFLSAFPGQYQCLYNLSTNNCLNNTATLKLHYSLIVSTIQWWISDMKSRYEKPILLQWSPMFRSSSRLGKWRCSQWFYFQSWKGAACVLCPMARM